MELEQLVGRAPVGKAEQLGEVAERALGGGRAGGRAAGSPPLPALGRTSPQAIFTSVDLPGAVRAEQADELARADLEVDAAERCYRAVALVKSADGECGLSPPIRQG